VFRDKIWTKFSFGRAFRVSNESALVGDYRFYRLDTQQGRVIEKFEYDIAAYLLIMIAKKVNYL
jgi:hypothetical protein